MALKPGSLATREDIMARILQLDLDILRQKRILAELEREAHPSNGARTLLGLLEDARRVLAEQVGPKV